MPKAIAKTAYRSLDADWPTMAPVKKEYRINVYCRRNGVSCDAGHHASCQSDNAKDAVEYLREITRKDLLFSYDEVHCTVFTEDDNGGGTVEVARFSLYRPEEKSYKDHPGCIDNYWNIYKKGQKNVESDR